MKNNLPINLINNYQNRNTLPNKRCIHYPTCSWYSKECYNKFNFLTASLKTFIRVLFCNRLNPNIVDLPLKNKEKSLLKKKSKSVIPYLLYIQDKYPLSCLDDYIKFIYQRNFGPSHYNINKDDLINNLNQELCNSNKTTDYIERLGNGYSRYYYSTKTNIYKLVECFIQSQTNNQDNTNNFLYELNELIKLIKYRKINLNYYVSYIDMINYLNNGIRQLHHTNRYKYNYNPQYLIIKDELIKNIK